MHEFVTGVRRVVVLRCEPQVRRLPSPDRKWVNTCNYDPLSDIKLLSQDDEWTLDIFLYNPNR